MILNDQISKLVVNGKTTYDFGMFCSGKKHIIGMDRLGSYGKIAAIESQTYEDPMILAMNLCDDPDDNKAFLSREAGFSDGEIESLGTLTGKYAAKDKITSSAVDLLGEEFIQRLMHISDTHNPYRFDLRRGALARVAGGGIHFSDEIFKNKKDLVQVYLGVIQN